MEQMGGAGGMGGMPGMGGADFGGDSDDEGDEGKGKGKAAASVGPVGCDTWKVAVKLTFSLKRSSKRSKGSDRHPSHGRMNIQCHRYIPSGGPRMFRGQSQISFHMIWGLDSSVHPRSPVKARRPGSITVRMPYGHICITGHWQTCEH
jgi:hypothetical protein